MTGHLPNFRHALALLCLLLFSCTGQEAALTFWVGGAPREVDYLEELIGEFEAKAGYQVEIVRQPTDSDQRRQGLVISLNGEQPDPDVFLMDVVWIGQFARSRWLAPLEISTEPFFQRVVELVDTYNDTLYALPLYVDGGLLYYRTDLLEQAGHSGPPRTWQQLLSWSIAIQDSLQDSIPSFSGFVWQGAQYEGLVCTFLEFASSNGGGIQAGDTILVNREANVTALEFMRDLIHQHQISPPNTYTEMKEEEVRRAFQRGNALFERNWPYAWKLHQSENSPVAGKVGIAPLPRFDGGESASTLGGWHIGMSRFSDVPQQARELIDFLTSFEVQKKMALNLGWNPGRRDVYTDEEVLADLPHLGELRDVFDYAVARPNLPYYTQISEIIQRYANDCLADNIDAPAALSGMQSEIDKILDYYESE